jgi:aminoacyl-tRNA hydrolase/ribosomal protein bL25 (Ctc-form)
MAQEKVVVEATNRETRGKNEARRLRLTGKIPAVLYGGKGEAITLSVNAKQVGAILRSESGHNTLFQVDLGGKHEPAILKDWLVDPVSGRLLHVDLLRIAMDVRMRVKVPVHTFGDPSGVKVQGGVFEVVEREVEVECLPADIPSEFRADVSGLALNQALRAGELQIDADKIKLITDKDRVLAHVVTLRVEEEKPADAVAADAATPAEPEVIKKGRDAPQFCAALGCECMRLIVGLGNPDPEYQWTPHNLGFMAVDELADRGAIRVERPEGKALVGRGKLAGEEILLAKPQTYMNLSGVSVRELLAKYELEPADLLVMWDEVQLPAGTFKIHPDGSAGSHNGAKSVIGSIGTQQFARLRLGCGPDHPVSNLKDYVLRPMKKPELEVASEMLGQVGDAVEMILTQGLDAAMTKYNRRKPQEPESEAGK